MPVYLGSGLMEFARTERFLFLTIAEYLLLNEVRAIAVLPVFGVSFECNLWEPGRQPKPRFNGG